MEVLTFSVFHWKYFLWEKFKYAEFIGNVNCFCFQSEIFSLSKFGPKNQNCQFKLEFVTKTNFNMWNSMKMFTFSIFKWKYPFLANLVQKIKNCQFKLEFCTWTSLNNLIQKLKSVHFFSSRTEIHFFDKLGPKNQNRQSILKFGTYNTSHKF